jgi:hypothetical protein
MFNVLPSEYVPVAVNCLVVPVVLVGLTGVTAIDVKVAVMVRVSARVTDCCGLPESVTRTVMLEVPATVDVPVIVPLPLSVKPGCRAPLASDHV